MNEPNEISNDPQLTALLRQARLAPDLPPRFQQSVWRRIQDTEVPPASATWLDALAAAILRPRFIVTGAALVLLAGVLAGTLEGRDAARQEARMNYLMSVAPQALR
jgi:hypothetical protein